MYQKMWRLRYSRPLISLNMMTLWITLCCAGLGCDPTPPPGSEFANDALVISPPPQRRDTGPETDQEVEVELPGPLFNSILPTRSPTRGGVRVRIIGAEFRAPMYVRIGGAPCEELIVETAARMICLVPAVEAPSVVDVTIAWLLEDSEVDPSSPEAESEIDGGARTLTEAFIYYQPLIVDAITPTRGPASGSTAVEITGEGFSEPMDVRFGDLPARNVVVESDTRLTVVTPASAPGVVGVSVRSAQEVNIIERGFNFQVPVGVTDVNPRWGSVAGGERVEIYGYGLYEDSVVDLNASRAQITQLTAPGRVSMSTPPSAQAGWATLRLENSNGVWIGDEQYLYLDDEDGPFEVLGIIPNQLPADRGGRVLIGGNGFTEETKVRLDDDELSCQLESPQRLNCFAPAHAPGEVDLLVRQGLLSERLTLRYINSLELYQLVPDRAAVSGGALIKARGRGLTPQSLFAFGDVEVPVERFESSEEVWLRAPPHPAALLDVTLREGSQEVFIPQAFSYFDPISRYGGVWGETIEGAVNVTTLNIYDFSPVPEVTVALRRFDEPSGAPLVTNSTNEQGQASLSVEGLTGPVHLTFAKSGFDVQTIERVSSENVTVLLYPFVPPEGMGDPPPPPEPVQISGVLTGLNDIPKPLEPGFVLRAFVDVSHQSMLSRAVNLPPDPSNILSEDGPFSITARPGQMALIGTAAYVPIETLERYERGEISYWLMRRETRPVKIGMIRFLSLSPAASVEGLTLPLNRDLDQRADVRLINPSSAAGTVFTDGFGEIQIVEDSHEVRAFLDLGPDGYWELDLGARSSETQLSILGLPDLSQWPDPPSLQWFVQTTVHPGGTNSFVYHEQSDLSRAVVMGPFVGAPYLESHGNGDLFRIGDTIRWGLWPGVDGTPVEPPQATTVRFYQGGFPVWTFTLPGGVNSFTVPPPPVDESGVGVFEGSVYVTFETLTTPQGLDYQDYNLLDLNSPLSYSTHQVELFFTR